MQVGIQTTQNVEINYEIASIGDRIIAAIIDYLVLFGYVVGCFFFFLAAQSLWTPTGAIIAALPIFFYDLLFEVFMDGQSLGKRQQKIKVIKVDGTQPDIGSYLLRWLVRLVEASLLLGGGSIAIVTILVNGKGQRLGDIAAGTTVVKIRPRITLEDTIFTAIEEEYVPMFPQVTQMTPQDAAIVREALTANEKDHDGVAAAMLCAKAKEVLGIQSELHPIPFLEILLKDYNYYTGR